MSRAGEQLELRATAKRTEPSRSCARLSSTDCEQSVRARIANFISPVGCWSWDQLGGPTHAEQSMPQIWPHAIRLEASWLPCAGGTTSAGGACGRARYWLAWPADLIPQLCQESSPAHGHGDQNGGPSDHAGEQISRHQVVVVVSSDYADEHAMQLFQLSVCRYNLI
jgi:hypothetical protein